MASASQPPPPAAQARKPAASPPNPAAVPPAPARQILVVGNPLVRSDSLPLRIRPALQKMFPAVDFMLFEPTVQEFPPAPQPLYILDSVEGLKGVRVLTGLD
ncbi:MAG: hypothetical protein KGH63_03165, partial [Candidatus Micrarchaeota archaeon]|nr:hypothetical protein [Candidatus Micrarchaeota archaeon]